MGTVFKRLVSILSPRTPEKPLPNVSKWAPLGYQSFTVPLHGGKSYELVFDVMTDDPIARAYREGYRANDHLSDQLGAFLKPGSWVLDLGAHIGTFSLAAAAAGCRVVAVDASPKHVDLLRRSKVKNGFDAMDVVHKAVGETPGTVRFHVAGLWGMVAPPGDAPFEVKGSPVIDVEMTTGDRLLRQHGCRRLDFLKMDIEGSEIAALRGLKRYLGRDDAPVIVYECNGLTLPHFGHSTADLVGLLESFGYRTYRMESGRMPLYRSHDFQPETWLDVVALKARHERMLGSGVIAPPLDTEEVIARSLQEAEKAHENQRAYIARALETAGPSILRDPRIRAVLETLGQDPHEKVRQSASWWTARQVRAA
jgi:FkbM family methyltransferase